MSSFVIVGLSQILSDLVDAIVTGGHELVGVVIDQELQPDLRDLSWSERRSHWRAVGVDPWECRLSDWRPGSDEQLLLGPTTPQRHRLVQQIEGRHGPQEWGRLVHPASYVSPLASLGPGCFVGAAALVAAGVRLGAHVFLNRGASIGHDTRLHDYVRVQPGATLGGLIEVGRGATLGMACCVLERLRIGAEATVAAGAVVTADVLPRSMVAGVPAQFKKDLPPLFAD